MPTSVFRSLFTTWMMTAVLTAAPTVANAACGGCSQPVTNGANPTASDCLVILKTAVGSATCNSCTACMCDPNASGGTSSTDSLICLKKAVGQNVTLNCGVECGGTTTTTVASCETNTPVGCPAKLNTCTSGDFVSKSGSDLDTGWNGLAHNQDLVDGATISVDVLRRCAANPNTICIVDSDCPSGDTCHPYCDCDDTNNSICEVTGPTGQKRCVSNLAPCTTSAQCGGGNCAHFFGPPLPVSAANTPACITSYFQKDITGTADSETGKGVASAFLRSRVHLGIDQARPCPTCGGASQNPKVGQVFNCLGGPKNNQACTVEAVSPVFGGVSSDCPPDSTTNVSGEGLAIRFRQVTTGTTSRTAEIPCLASGFCTDDFSGCSTNADCTRCTNDLTSCTTNADCSGGTCAAAPQQPVACGYYCHCGFCNNDPAAPCFNNDDCETGTCMPGNATTGGQSQPNNCSGDLICGRVNNEQCCNSTQDGSGACPADVSTPLTGKCSIKKYIACSLDASSDLFGACEQEVGAGTCVATTLPCFEHTISRTGEPSPLGSYCVDDPNKGACTKNSDCAAGTTCVADSSEPTTVALFCVPKTTSSAINAAGGIPGPGAITFKSAILACRCGDGKKGCSEQCDDGNNTNGDGCDQACRSE